MENRKATIFDVGKTYIARDIACGILLRKDNNILCIKRGSAVDEVGKWSIPCGYLNRDETCEEAALRELYEETGIKLENIDYHFLTCYIDDNPKSNKKQNVTFVYAYRIFEDININSILDIETFSKKEITEVKWISLEDIDKYEWAFNTKDILNKLI